MVWLQDMISERLFQIAAIAPTSPIGLAVKLLAEEQARDEKRRQGQRERTARCKAKKREPNVNLTREPNVNLTALYTVASTELREVSKIQPRNRGFRLPATWKMSPADLQFALDNGFTEDEALAEAASFLDYWLSVPGSRGCKLDWPATWRNRIRRLAWSRKITAPKRKSRDTAYAALDRIDAIANPAHHTAPNRLPLGAPVGKIIPIHQQRDHGGNDRFHGADIHQISRKPIE